MTSAQEHGGGRPSSRPLLLSPLRPAQRPPIRLLRDSDTTACVSVTLVSLAQEKGSSLSVLFTIFTPSKEGMVAWGRLLGEVVSELGFTEVHAWWVGDRRQPCGD